MPTFRIKQRVIHPIHGPGSVIKVDHPIVTVMFDNDKELPLRINIDLSPIKHLEDF